MQTKVKVINVIPLIQVNKLTINIIVHFQYNCTIIHYTSFGYSFGLWPEYKSNDKYSVDTTGVGINNFRYKLIFCCYTICNQN